MEFCISGLVSMRKEPFQRRNLACDVITAGCLVTLVASDTCTSSDSCPRLPGNFLIGVLSKYVAAHAAGAAASAAAAGAASAAAASAAAHQVRSIPAALHPGLSIRRKTPFLPFSGGWAVCRELP